MKVEVISDDEAAPEDELERELEKAMDQHLASGAPNSLPKPAEDSSALDSLPKPAPNDVAGNSLDEAVAAEKANLAESLPLPDDDARKQQLAMKAAEKEKKEAEKKKQALAKEQKVAVKARKEAEKLEKQKLKEEQKKQKEQEKAEKAEEKKRKAEAKKSEAGAKSSKVASQAGSDGGATGSSSMDPAAAPLPSEAPGAEAAEEAAVDQDQEEVADAEDVADAQKSAQKAKRQRKRKAEGDEPKPKGRPRKAESSEAAPAAEPKQKANRTRRGRGQTVDGALVKQIGQFMVQWQSQNYQKEIHTLHKNVPGMNVYWTEAAGIKLQKPDGKKWQVCYFQFTWEKTCTMAVNLMLALKFREKLLESEPEWPESDAAGDFYGILVRSAQKAHDLLAAPAK